MTIEQLTLELEERHKVDLENAKRIDRLTEQLNSALQTINTIRREVESVNGRYSHPDLLERAVCIAFDNIRGHLSNFGGKK